MKTNLGSCLIAALLLCLPGCGKKNEDGEGAAYKYSCKYVNPYSQGTECIEYHGDWTEAEARPHCESLYSASTFQAEFGESPCDLGADCVASCAQESDDGKPFISRFYGAETDMAMTEQFCEGAEFGNGAFSAGCAEAGEEVDAGGAPASTLEQEALDAMVSDDAVTVDPECADDACVAALAEAGQWITFTPTGAAPETGFIFYPGGSIDPRAYAPAARAIAAKGVLVVLVPMVGNFAPNGYDRATAIEEAHADIAQWFLGGHSLGGIAAIQYVQENDGAVNGLILWATYGTDEYDLVDSATPVTVISGSEDGLSTPEEIEDGKPFLPADAVYIALPGANHAQFGYYGEQDGDGLPDISKENQQELVVASTLHSIKRVLAGGATPHTAFAGAGGELADWCLKAQRAITGISEADLPAASVDQIAPDNLDDYVSCHAEIDATAGKSSICTLLHYGGNAELLTAPPFYQDGIWCKMKDQASLVSELGLTAAGAQGTCADLNETALNWALDNVTAGEKAAYEASGKSLVFGDDIPAETGPGWISDTQTTLAETATSGVYELRAATLIVGNDTNYPANSRNVVYCKLWTPARALYWVLAQQ